LLRGLVLGVLAQVAELARALDLLRELDLQLALQRGDLIIEALEDPILHLGSDFSIRSRPHPGRSLRAACPAAPMKIVASRQNPVVRACRALANRPDPHGARLLLDGAHLVREAAGAGLEFEVVCVASSRVDRE